MVFIAHVKGERSNAIIAQGLRILADLDHRGGVGADPAMGGRAGSLIQVPEALLRAWAESQRLNLTAPGGCYAVAMCFLPCDEDSRGAAKEGLEHFVRLEGQREGRDCAAAVHQHLTAEVRA
jgi:glutamate synthase (NADPH/NADH) large chain